MIAKLVLRNMKRSLKDYGIYIATVTICVGILFAFLSVAFSKSIGELAENMSILQDGLIILSVLLMFVFSYLINYAMKFIIKRRKIEFGTYMLLGLERKYLFKIFFTENVILGILSFFIGLPLGILIYNILNAMIMNLFDCEYSVEFALSVPALILSLVLFLIVYGVNALKSSRQVSKMKIKDLIYGARYNEVSRIKNPKTGLALIFLFLVISAVSIFGIFSSLKINDNRFYIYNILGVLGLGFGIYGLHASCPVLIYFIKKGAVNWLYKGTNIFLAGQISSKINSTSKTIAVCALTLTFALMLLMGGLSFGAVYKINIKYEAPFDIAVAFDADVDSFKDVVDFVNTKSPVKDYIEYKIYHSDEENLKNVPIMRLSDYNKLREILVLDKKVMKEDNFIIHSEEWSVRKKIEERLKQNNKISIDGIMLSTSKELIFGEPFEQSRTNGTEGYIFVFPDYVCDKLESNKSRLIISTKEQAPQSLKNELNRYIRKEWRPNIISHNMQEMITISVIVKSWSIANGLMGLSVLSFSSIYISLILFLISGTILSLHQSTEVVESSYRYTILKKLGTREADILGIIKKQIGIYFALPSFIPNLITVISGIILNRKFAEYILTENLVLLYTAIALAIFMIVYGCYMILSFKIYKWSIFNRKDI